MYSLSTGLFFRRIFTRLRGPSPPPISPRTWLGPLPKRFWDLVETMLSRVRKPMTPPVFPDTDFILGLTDTWGPWLHCTARAAGSEKANTTTRPQSSMGIPSRLRTTRGPNHHNFCSCFEIQLFLYLDSRQTTISGCAPRRSEPGSCSALERT